MGCGEWGPAAAAAAIPRRLCAARPTAPHPHPPSDRNSAQLKLASWASLTLWDPALRCSLGRAAAQLKLVNWAGALSEAEQALALQPG